jgi:hypothetical protein
MLLSRFKALAVDGSETAAAGESARTKRSGEAWTAAQRGPESRSLRTTPDAARIHRKNGQREARRAKRLTPNG